MNQQAEIHIFINYSDLDKIRTDLKFNSAKVAGYLRYYKCKANSEGISKMTSNERQKKIIRLLDKRRKDTMEHLSIEFHVSTDTISRDIASPVRFLCWTSTMWPNQKRGLCAQPRGCCPRCMTSLNAGVVGFAQTHQSANCGISTDTTPNSGSFCLNYRTCRINPPNVLVGDALFVR